jgi:DNA-binding LacI/PurR family transcriptional regulator
MVALHEHNISIPDDVSIIGYDDIDIAALIKVPLTTIRQPKFRMGKIAATQLIEMIEKKERGLSRQFVMKPELIIRESCKKHKQ